MLLHCTISRLVIAALLFALIAINVPAGAAAQEEPAGETATWIGMWQEHRLTVTVIARGHTISDSIQSSSPWWQWGNTTTDAYLFTWSSDGLVDLILDFSTAGDRTEARLYAPVLQSQRVGVRVGAGSLTIPDNLAPSYVIWPSWGTWLEDGLPNFNLRATEYRLDTGLPAWDTTVGSNSPGAPDWVIRQLIDDPDPSAGYARFEAAVRKDPTVEYELAEPLMPSWPYLSAYGSDGHYGKIHPLSFDPEARALGHNWAGFHVAGMYQINSINYPPDTNFESPFAFYRFDPGFGLYPNMVIRSDVWPEGHEFGPQPFYEQRTSVRMTWTGRESTDWRYSISVTGNHPADETVAIGNVEFEAMSYESYPGWITSRDWKAMTFVESVPGEPGSEGIYEYSVEDNYTVAEWVNGLRVTPPVEVPGTSDDIAGFPEWNASVLTDSPFADFPLYHPQRMAPGFRGEHSFVYQREPALYLSGVDGRVHLLHAEGGGWKLDTNRVLRVENLDGDAYVDAWIRERVPVDSNTGEGDPVILPPVLEEAIYVLGDRVLYVTPERAELYRLDEPPLVQPLEIPVGEQSWHGFLDRAEGAEQQDPEAFGGWLEGLQLTPLAVFEGVVSQVRPVEGGLRFDHLNGSGVFVVTANERIDVERARPHDISAALTVTPLTAREPGFVTVQLHQQGNRDLTGATLEVVATSGSGIRTVVDRRNASILAGERVDIDVEWAPPTSEVWTVQVQFIEGLRTLLAESSVQLQVAPQEVQLESVTAEGLTRETILLAVGLLVVAAAGAGVAGWRLLGRNYTEHNDGFA